MAAVVLSACINLTVSTPKVDIVVKPPKRPVPRKRIVSVWIAEANIAPIRNAPRRFTAIVAHGTSASLLVGKNSETPQRATEPNAPPRPTSKAGCMMVAGTGGA